MKQRFTYFSIQLPKTIYGFPVSLEKEVSSSCEKNLPRRGIALLLTVMITGILISFVTDLIIVSRVELGLATINQNRIKAEYLAKSAYSLGSILVSLDWMYDMFLQLRSQTKAPPPEDGSGDFWTYMNGKKIGGDNIEMLKLFQKSMGLNKIMDSQVLDQLKLFDGSFEVNVTDEASKININYCAPKKRRSGACLMTIAALEKLFNCPVEKAYFESKDINTEELIARIKDWSDSNRDPDLQSNLGSEDEPYVPLGYKAKNAPFDSIDEMMLVDLWTPEMQTIFSPYLTVFPFSFVDKKGHLEQLININTATKELLKCLVPPTSEENDIDEYSEAEAKKDDRSSMSIKSILEKNFHYDMSSESELKNYQKPSKWFGKTSKFFRIKAKGIVQNQERIIEVVFERISRERLTKYRQQMFRRSDPVTRILYWKMI